MGFFAAQDRITNLLFPSNQGSMQASLDQDAFGGVFRLRQDVGKMSTLGVLYTGRAGSDYSNHVAGADGFFRLDQKNSITFQFLHSETDYPDGRRPGLRPEGRPLRRQRRQLRVPALLAVTGSSTRPTRTCRRASGPTTGSCPASIPGTSQAMVFRQIWGKPKSWFNYIRLGAAGRVRLRPRRAR